LSKPVESVNFDILCDTDTAFGLALGSINDLGWHIMSIDLLDNSVLCNTGNIIVKIPFIKIRSHVAHATFKNNFELTVRVEQIEQNKNRVSTTALIATRFKSDVHLLPKAFNSLQSMIERNFGHISDKRATNRPISRLQKILSEIQERFSKFVPSLKEEELLIYEEGVRFSTNQTVYRGRSSGAGVSFPLGKKVRIGASNRSYSGYSETRLVYDSSGVMLLSDKAIYLLTEFGMHSFIPLESIQSAGLEFGTIVISIKKGSGIGKIGLQFRDRNEGQSRLCESIAKAATRTAKNLSSRSQVQTPDPIVLIEELAKLKDKGIITTDEFKRKKKELLDKL
jgi:hypothetical protein